MVGFLGEFALLQTGKFEDVLPLLPHLLQALHPPPLQDMDAVLQRTHQALIAALLLPQQPHLSLKTSLLPRALLQQVVISPVQLPQIAAQHPHLLLLLLLLLHHPPHLSFQLPVFLKHPRYLDALVVAFLVQLVQVLIFELLRLEVVAQELLVIGEHYLVLIGLPMVGSGGVRQVWDDGYTLLMRQG